MTPLSLNYHAHIYVFHYILCSQSLNNIRFTNTRHLLFHRPIRHGKHHTTIISFTHFISPSHLFFSFEELSSSEVSVSVMLKPIYCSPIPHTIWDPFNLPLHQLLCKHSEEASGLYVLPSPDRVWWPLFLKSPSGSLMTQSLHQTAGIKGFVR